MKLVKEKNIIGVDLGGTWVRLALSNEEGCFIGKVQERVDNSSEKAVVKQIIGMIRLVCEKINVDPASLEGVGIASAGPLGNS